LNFGQWIGVFVALQLYCSIFNSAGTKTSPLKIISEKKNQFFFQADFKILDVAYFFSISCDVPYVVVLIFFFFPIKIVCSVDYGIFVSIVCRETVSLFAVNVSVY